MDNAERQKPSIHPFLRVMLKALLWMTVGFLLALVLGMRFGQFTIHIRVERGIDGKAGISEISTPEYLGVAAANSRHLLEPTSETKSGNAPVALPLRCNVDVLRVVDGDTIRVLWEGESTAVRLLGIDAPERKQPGFKESRDYLVKRLGDKQVTLEFPTGKIKYDIYGRLLAVLWQDDVNICTELVEKGHAVKYR